MSKYADIIARLEKATRANLQLERDIDAFCHFGSPGALDRTPPPYTASIDAAIALVERMLPGWRFNARMVSPNGYSCWLEAGTEGVVEVFAPIGYATTLPVAILLALFRTLDAQEDQQ